MIGEGHSSFYFSTLIFKSKNDTPSSCRNECEHTKKSQAPARTWITINLIFVSHCLKSLQFLLSFSDLYLQSDPRLVRLAAR